MSRTYNMTVIVCGYVPEKADAIRDEVDGEWEFDSWDTIEHSGEQPRLLGSGVGQLCGGEQEQEFVDRMAGAIWRANGVYCEVEVQTVYLDDHPHDCYLADEADYERLINGLVPDATTTAPETTLRSYDLTIDGPLLRVQRERLFQLMDALLRDRPVSLGPTDRDLLEGLVNLTDEIADQTPSRHGIDCLLPNMTHHAQEDNPE